MKALMPKVGWSFGHSYDGDEENAGGAKKLGYEAADGIEKSAKRAVG